MDKAALLERYDEIISSINLSLEELTFSQFVEQGFPLSGDDRFTHFDITLAPWFRNLAKWIEDPAVEYIYLVQGSQTAKTTFLMACLAYYSQHAKGHCPMFWVSPTEAEAMIFIQDRLKPFLQNQVCDNHELYIDPKKWKQVAFRVHNSFVKVGYASAIASIRSYPARILLGDEIGIWRNPVEYLHKRARTFSGTRKGIFGSTPPFDSDSPSWATVKKADWYQLHVPCPHCGHKQFLSFNRIKWYEQTVDERKAGEPWDFKRVRETARYYCEACNEPWDEHRKMELCAQGELVCVSPDDFKPCEPHDGAAKALHLPSTYSPFTTWGELAVAFLRAKAAGKHALDTFITDELAEVPKKDNVEQTVKPSAFSPFISLDRLRGFHDGYHLYTMGIDVQGNGALYINLLGFLGGNEMSAHVLDYRCLRWKNDVGVPDWSELLNYVLPFRHRLYCAGLDATDGVTQPEVIAFCRQQGHPFYPIIDRGSSPIVKAEWKAPNAHKKVTSYNKGVIFDKYLMVNSAHFKNDIVSAMERDPGATDAWSFPKDTEDLYFQHLSNEKRIPGTDNRGRPTYKWVPRYGNAEQHYLSSYVYALSTAEDQKKMLSRSESAGKNQRQQRRFRSQGVSPWR